MIRSLLPAALALLLAASPARAAVAVKETGRVRRPFSWQTTRLSADFVKFSAASMKGGGVEGAVTGLLGLVLTVPMLLLSPPADLVAAPFRKRRFVRWEIDSRVIDEVGGPVGEAPILAQSVGLRQTIEDRKSYELYRSSSVARTDPDGRFTVSGTGYFGPNRDILVRVSVGEPPRPVSTLRLTLKRGKARAERADDSIAGRYRLDPPFPDEAWDD